MKHQSEICKARSLFITRGILNREVLPSEIVYSWVRSKLHNISFELIDRNDRESQMNIMNLKKEHTSVISRLRKYAVESHAIFLVNPNGQVLYQNESSRVKFPRVSNFKEEYVGTTAAGISLVNGKDASVFGCEHFNGEFTTFISQTIVIGDDIAGERQIIQVMSPISQEIAHKRLIDAISTQFLKEVETPIDQDSKEEILPVNTVKTVVKTPQNTPSENHVGSSDNNDCKQFTLKIIEENTIRSALDYYHWNLKKASEALGIGRSTLYRKLKEYNIKE